MRIRQFQTGNAVQYLLFHFWVPNLYTKSISQIPCRRLQLLPSKLYHILIKILFEINRLLIGIESSSTIVNDILYLRNPEGRGIIRQLFWHLDRESFYMLNRFEQQKFPVSLEFKNLRIPICKIGQWQSLSLSFRVFVVSFIDRIVILDMMSLREQRTVCNTQIYEGCSTPFAISDVFLAFAGSEVCLSFFQFFFQLEKNRL